MVGDYVSQGSSKKQNYKDIYTERFILRFWLT